MKKKLFNALSLAVIMAMLVTSLALADNLVVDGDIATSGVGNSQFELCEGESDFVIVGVNLKWNGNTHFNNGVVNVSASVNGAGSSFITAESGSLTLENWDSNKDEVSTSLKLTVGTNWKLAMNANSGPYKVTYTLNQNGNSYTVSSDDNVQITEKISGCTSSNTAPEVSANSTSVTVDEGQPASNTGRWSDADGDPVTLSANVGTIIENADGTWSWSFATTDGPYDSQTITITANDGQATSSTTFDLIVNNVSPVVIAEWANTTVACRVPATLNFGFTDAGVNDKPWAVNIDWNDGSTSYNTDTQGAQPSQAHTYNAPGIYSATVGVTDKDGGYGFATSGNLTVLQTYTINFLQPIDASTASLAVTNTMKSGRTVPVKVTIWDDCAQAYVTDPATMVKIFLSAGVSTGGSNDAVEIYADAGASNGNTLYFRWTSDTSAPGGGFWIYNLDSKTALNGSAFVVGTTYRVDVFVGGVKATTSKWALLKANK